MNDALQISNNTTLVSPTTQAGVATVFIINIIISFCGLCLFCCTRHLKIFKSKLSKRGKQWSSFFKTIWSNLINRTPYELIAKEYGHEVAVYLWFEKHLLGIVAICTAISLTIVLPVHLSGSIRDTSGGVRCSKFF